MTQIFKSIIDKILWAKLDIDEVVKAYKAEAKERADTQKRIDEAQPKPKTEAKPNTNK